MLRLEELGWTPRFAEAFEPHRARGLFPARVSLEHTHIYRVLSTDGERLARVAGRLMDGEVPRCPMSQPADRC